MTERIPTVSVDEIDALLPQTQCTKCGYNGCRPYAEAIAAGDAINKCPPGGAAGIRKLAALLGQPEVPLDTTHGEERAVPLVAFIREAECIGCTKCIQACPVDAIIGAAKLMHTVVTDLCTGCDLCVAPCPVDCIDMVPAPVTKVASAEAQAADEHGKAQRARERYLRRQARLARQAAEKEARRQAAATAISQATPQAEQQTDRRARVQASVAAALDAVRERARTTPEARDKLVRTLASATERFERADAKVEDARRSGSDQLPMLQARREDMRFKLEEARRKLAAYDREAAFGAAADRMATLRQRKTDSERIAQGLEVIASKLAVLQAGLATAQGEQRLALEAEIARLLAKQADAHAALHALDHPDEG